MRKGLKAIAMIEAFKGVVALAAGFELHNLAGRNIQQALEEMAAQLHLNPGSNFPGIFSSNLGFLNNSNLMLVATGTIIYAIVRFIEAYGLWKEMVWTEWFAIVSAAIYIPFEVYEVIFNTSSMSIAALIINLSIVCYLYSVLRSNQRNNVH